MNESNSECSEEKDVITFSGENQRLEARRVGDERRDEIRYELKKSPRRSGNDRRLIDLFIPQPEDESHEHEDNDDSIFGFVSGLIVNKISHVFKR